MIIKILFFLLFALITPLITTCLAQSPGGVSAGAELWFRADVGTNCNTNTCVINDWAEQFATGNDASQPTAALRPEFFSSTPELNFNPAIRYSGSQRLAIENLNYTNQDRLSLIHI